MFFRKGFQVNGKGRNGEMKGLLMRTLSGYIEDI